MVKFLLFICTLLILDCGAFQGQSSKHSMASPVPFSKGINFSSWFEYIPKSASEIHNRYNEQDFADAKQLGFDVIRIPIDFYSFTSGAPDYQLDPLLIKLLDMTVDWAEKHQIYVIFDFHPENQPVIDNSIRDFLLPVWQQMAESFKNRGEYVIYEILNEPHGISAKDWGKIQGDVINAIRGIDQNHWIVVGGTSNNSINALFSLPKYADKKLLYTFHYYEPYIFTHQGVDSLTNLTGVPFPYEKSRMPSVPTDLNGTWAERTIKYKYFYEGTGKALERKIKNAAKFAKKRNVPVFCGEFGALNRYSLPEDRVTWHQYTREALEKNNLPWLKWSYYDCLGIFNSQLDGVFRWASPGDINIDLNIELIRALGLTEIPQRQREAVQSSFSIFEDSFSRGVSIYYPMENTVNLFYTPAAEGNYAIHLGDLHRIDDRWDGLVLMLSVMDLSYLVENGYYLEFMARKEKPFQIDVSFYNFQDNINWKKGFAVDDEQIPPDGRWHTVRIPLEDMQTWGGIDNDTFQYVQALDEIVSWTKINMLEFIAVQEDNSIQDLYLDSIRITR